MARSSAKILGWFAGHEASGTPVSELTVGASNPVNHNVRTEKRAGNANLTRTFTYSAAGYCHLGHRLHGSFS